MSKKTHPIFIVDAFSPGPFGGNQAAVCLLMEDISDVEKQRIAAEMNLSETAFVVPEVQQGNTASLERVFGSTKRFGLRWFTPATEVPLCGHATLATAAIVFTKMWNTNQVLEFQTKSAGVLTCRKAADNQIEMVFPSDPPDDVDYKSDAGLLRLVERALGPETSAKVAEAALSPRLHHALIVRLKDGSFDRAGFESIKVAAAGLANVDTGDKLVTGFILTIKGEDGGEYDFLSRYFADWMGVAEDPVTGSSFSTLTPFWSPRLGKTEMTARQCSKRGGVVKIEYAAGGPGRGQGHHQRDGHHHGVRDGGNPAGVCLLSTPSVSDREKQILAAEINCSATAFVSCFVDGSSFSDSPAFLLSWFTPSAKEPICGHATLAAAKVIFDVAGNRNTALEFRTENVGALTCRRVEEEGESDLLELSLPLHPAEPVDLRKDSALLDLALVAVGADALALIAEAALCPDLHRVLVLRLKDGCMDRRQFQSMEVPADDLDRVDTGGRVAGLILTLRGDGKEGPYQFLSRYFGKWIGVPEDSVTGSSFCTLGPFWSSRLGLSEMRARQCSLRGGDVVVVVQQDRVKLRAEATVVLSGEIQY